MIFLYPILFLLWSYTMTINGNVRDTIEMCSALLQI